MPPVAPLLAALLHAATALALFWVSPLNRSRDVEDNAVEVTFEEPKSPEPPPVQEAVQQPVPPPPPPAPTPAPAPAPPPPPSPAAEAKPPQPPPAASAKPEPKPQPQARSSEPLGVSPAPPEAKKADEPKPQPSEAKKPDEPKPQPPQEAKLEPQQPADAKPQAQQEAKAEPPTKPAEPPPQQEAVARPETPPPAPEPPVEKIVPPVETPPAPLTMRDFVKVLPPPPAPRSAPSPQPQQPAPQPHALQHSPLSTGPAPPQPGSSGASVSTLVNPASEAAQTRAKDAYLWQVIRKFSQYLPDLREKNEGGTVVLRFVIARDGRLVEASIAKSSGVVALDRGLLDSLRAASPYPPLPAEIPGSQVVFVQPIAAKR